MGERDDWLWAELAVRNLLARLAHLADEGDLDEYAELFTADASWEFPGAPWRGRADILAGAIDRRASGLTGPGSASRHLISTVSVEVVDAATAIADSYFQFWRETTTAPRLFNMGHYHDTLVVEGGRWRLARREITIG